MIQKYKHKYQVWKHMKVQGFIEESYEFETEEQASVELLQVLCQIYFIRIQNRYFMTDLFKLFFQRGFDRIVVDFIDLRNYA